MNRGEVDAVFFLNSNPAYEFNDAKAFTDALSKVKLRVSFADRKDETASLCQLIAPNHHYLQSWGDSNPVEGYYTIIQPAINPVYNSRNAEQGLLIWSENPVTDYYQYIQNNWSKSVLAQSGTTWKELLQKGSVTLPAKSTGVYSFQRELNSVVQTIIAESNSLAKGCENGIELHIYQNVAIGDGKAANNPWLQELPYPVSKVTWDNYAAINPKFAEKLGIAELDLVEIKTDKYSVTLPVLIQPGQATGTVSVALGYGRVKAGKAGSEIGKNAYPFLRLVNATLQISTSASISKASGTYELAQTQTHHTI